MRVTGGELSGRRLRGPPRGAELRPTSDKVREALFSILGEIGGLRVLDLYCGTGALAIEALSRGAERAALVDLDVRPARRNVEALALGERAELIRSDALRFLGRDERRYGLILCDPPYRLAARLEPDLEKLLPARLAYGGRLVIETAAREPVRLALPLELERRYGDTLLSVWRIENPDD